MKRKLCELVLILVFYALQCTAGRAFAIGGIVPNLLVILPVLFGILKGRGEGIYVGFLCGLIYDLYTYDVLGLSSIAMMLVGYFSGFMYQKYEEKEFLIPVVLVAGASLFYGFMSYVVNFLLHNSLDIGYYVSRFIMPETVYTVCVAIVIYRGIVFLNRLFEKKPRKRTTEYDAGNI
jgi:rod shape-determining protein MreD